ncbi:MAG: hypothetical protein JSU63_20400 [Phycisphaerales bacterium]|nr:MAG: hypothetical protein JSU63_20400 [Phycisphaerales bacterium]
MNANHFSRSGWTRWAAAAGVVFFVGLCLTAVSPAVAQVDNATQSTEPAADSAKPAEQTETQSDQAPSQAEAPIPKSAQPAPPQPGEPKDPKSYDYWVLLPAILAIILAILTRQVVPALVVGIIVGAYMMIPCLPAGDAFASQNPLVGGFRLAAEKYVIGAIDQAPEEDNARLKIIIFTMAIGFMVGVLSRNGGTAGMVKVVAGDTESPRRGALTAWLAGLVVFFDDYANTMIVGPTMRSVFDRLKMSRAKLAYIVDSTAAPVASIAIIGTWVGAEIGFIQVGLDEVAESGAPAFLLNDQGSVMGGMQTFIASIPYRFYPIFALILVFFIALTGRDFGPMKRSEGRALGAKEDDAPDKTATLDKAEDEPAPRWWLGLLPVLVLVGATIAILIITGYSAGGGSDIMARDIPAWQKAFEIINAADSYISILYGAILAAILAMILTVISRACSVQAAADAGLKGMARMFPAIVILVLAWALSAVEQDLALGSVVTAKLKAANFPVEWMPLAIFVCAAVVSFATGTSWGTMGILCPVAVTIMAGLAASIAPEQALPLFYAGVGSVLAGAIFGDHCSPISDTTVLSSVASGCRHEEHVWTQLPYAIVGAIVAIGLGDVMCSVYAQPLHYGLGGGAVLLFLIVLAFGRHAEPPLPPMPTGPPDSPVLGPAPAIEKRLRG